MQGIIITIVVSILIGSLGAFRGGDPFIWFSLSFIGQFILFFLYNVSMQAWKQMQVNKLTVLRLNAIELNRTVLPCAVCKQPNEADILINEKTNEFRCAHCNTLNSVHVSLTAIQKTEIVDGIITDDIAKKLVQDSETIHSAEEEAK